MRCTICTHRKSSLFVIDVLIHESRKTIEVCHRCLRFCPYQVLHQHTGRPVPSSHLLRMDEEARIRMDRAVERQARYIQRKYGT